MPAVFLSHHSADKEKAEAFIERLEQRPLAREHSLTVWLDKTHLLQGEQFTDKFSRHINDTNTCAFILFLPQKVMRSYVEYEIGIALNRHLEAKNSGEKFPLLPLIPMYPGVDCGAVELPEIIDTFQARRFAHNDPNELDAIICDILGLSPTLTEQFATEQQTKLASGNSVGDGPDSGKNLPESGSDTSDNSVGWHSFILSCDDVSLTAKDDKGTRFVLPLSDLSASLDDPVSLRQLAGWLINNGSNHSTPDSSAPVRLRVMTEDAGLAMLPWHLLPDPASDGLLVDSGWIIECGPALGRAYRREFVEFSPHSPLLVIPAEEGHKLSGDSHYRVVQSHLEAYLEIRGIIQRAQRVSELRRELTAQPPDLLYVYARFDGERVLLDQDGRGSNSFTLEELGQWLAETGAFPAVVLNLLGAELVDYPQTLVANCRLLWVQSTSRKTNKAVETLRENLAGVITGLADNPDLTALIQQRMIQMNRPVPLIGTNSRLWLNSKSPQLTAAKSSDKQLQRIRAALLKVLLGREGLKTQMAGGVMKALGQQGTLLSYAVTGHADACPHDVPEQIRQRLQWDNIQNSLPVVSYYFNIALQPGRDVINLLDQAIENSLLCGSDDAETVLRAELERRGLDGQPCCISLNWFFRLDETTAVVLEQWLEQWGRLVWESFGHIQLEQATIVNAVCLQVSDAVDAHATHQTANRVLRSLRNQVDCNIQPMIYKHALEELDEGEIEDFLDNEGRFWYRKLKMDQIMDQHDQPIESSAFAEWLIAQTKGKFEQTVQTIWREYQQGYRGYLQS